MEHIGLALKNDVAGEGKVFFAEMGSQTVQARGPWGNGYNHSSLRALEILKVGSIRVRLALA